MVKGILEDKSNCLPEFFYDINVTITEKIRL